MALIRNVQPVKPSRFSHKARYLLNKKPLSEKRGNATGAYFNGDDNFVADNGHIVKVKDVAWWAMMPAIPLVTPSPCYLCGDRPGIVKHDGFDICSKCEAEMG